MPWARGGQSADLNLKPALWLYLPVVIDLFSRRVVGWAVSDRLHRDLALAALRKALIMRRPPKGLIYHSDRGSQYCSVDYQAELRRHGIRRSTVSSNIFLAEEARRAGGGRRKIRVCLLGDSDC